MYVCSFVFHLMACLSQLGLLLLLLLCVCNTISYGHSGALLDRYDRFKYIFFEGELHRIDVDLYSYGNP